MARPPRIPMLLPYQVEAVYFLSVCIHPRVDALANAKAWSTIQEILVRLDKWIVIAALAMPDHLHLLIAPKERELSVSEFLKWFKRWFNEGYPHPGWEWQEGGFDRLLRGGESAPEKWRYIEQNPVRAGLVKNADEWPYAFFKDRIL